MVSKAIKFRPDPKALVRAIDKARRSGSKPPKLNPDDVEDVLDVALEETAKQAKERDRKTQEAITTLHEITEAVT